MYRQLNLKNRRSPLFGACGTYFQLSPRRGVKVYGFTEEMSEGVETPELLNFSEVKSDFDFMKKIKCSITPAAHEIVAVKLHGYWFVGLIMDHVNGVHLHELGVSNGSIMIKVAQRFTKETGYIHGDLNGYNVLFNKKSKRFKVIDINFDTSTPSNKQGEYL